jgi:hypothetical protein
MTSYIHNLKIILVDSDENIILDHDFLDEIKHVLCQSNTKYVEWNNKYIPVIIKWDKKELNKIDKHVMGDLFTHSIYDDDSIIVNHTTQVISSIKNPTKHKIKIYISRLIGEKTICPGSYGIV